MATQRRAVSGIISRHFAPSITEGGHSGRLTLPRLPIWRKPGMGGCLAKYRLRGLVKAVLEIARVRRLIRCTAGILEPQASSRRLTDCDPVPRINCGAWSRAFPVRSAAGTVQTREFSPDLESFLHLAASTGRRNHQKPKTQHRPGPPWPCSPGKNLNEKRNSP